MSSASSGDDGRKIAKDRGSTSVEEVDKGRRSSLVKDADKGGEISLKKRTWTQAEDAILIEYIEKHGEGNWNAIQKNSGLARCGHSCRLRWVNHFRPNLKKGAFTKEEEQLIIQLHAIMGNKWAKIAAKLPGRTNNEIKNFWNTKRMQQRAGLTTFLDETEIHRQQVSNGNQENLNPNVALTNEAGKHDSVSQTPDDEFRRLTVPPSLYDPSLYMPMPPVSGMLPQLEQCTYSSQYNMLPMPMMHPSKRLRGSDMIYNSLDPSAVPTFDQYDTSDPRLLCPYNLTGSHADLNGNISTSYDPIYGKFKVELPSLQYFEAQKRIWSTPESSRPPLLEAADTPESSSQFQPNQSGTVSQQNNDSLLESVIYGYNNLNGSNNVDSFQENNDHYVCNEVVQNSTLNPSETQLDEQEELRSSLGPYAASVLADYTYITTQNDKHGTLTEFPADSPSQESQNPIDFLLDPDAAPDLSYIQNYYSNGDS